MNTVLIAGAGQLGSRHLQGLKLSKNVLDIWVFDLSEDSLKVAEDRYNQLDTETEKSVHFVTSLDEVPSSLDVVIIASSSKPRYAITTNLLYAHNVKYLILEKFLFPRLSDYSEISKLLKEKNVSAWVNCPRRMWDGYSYIKSLINTEEPIEYRYEGSDWGMCCNTIHFVDIFMHLCGHKLLDVNIEYLDKEVKESKRPGYVEVHGTEQFSTPNNDKLILSSFENNDETPHVIIRNGDKTIDYYEGKGEMIVNGEIKKVPVHYQSTLTGILIDELLGTGKCRLSTYKESSRYHIAYLKMIAPFINKIKGWTSDACPIT